METTPSHTEQSQNDPIRVHIIADDDGKFPPVGTTLEYGSGYPLQIGNSTGQDPYYYMDVDRKAETMGRGAVMSDSDFKRGLDLIKRMDQEVEAGVQKRDSIKLTPDEENLVGRVRERMQATTTPRMQVAKPPMVKPEEISKNPWISKIISKVNMDNINVTTEKGRKQVLVALINDIVRGQGVFNDTGDFAEMVRSGAIAGHKQGKAAAAMNIGMYTTDARGEPIETGLRRSQTSVAGDKAFIDWLYSEDGIRTVVGLREELATSDKDALQVIEDSIVELPADRTASRQVIETEFVDNRLNVTPEYKPYQADDVYEDVSVSEVSRMEEKSYQEKLARVNAREEDLINKSAIPNVENRISYDDPTTDEVVAIRKIQRALLFLLTRRSTKAFWYGRYDIRGEMNMDVEDIRRSSKRIAAILNDMDSHMELGAAEAQAALSQFEDETGLVIPAEETVIVLKDSMPIDESGILGKQNMMLTPSENELKNPVNRAAYAIYSKMADDAARSRLSAPAMSISVLEKTESLVGERETGMPETPEEKTFIDLLIGNGSAPGVSSKEMAKVDKAISKMSDIKLRALMQEIRIQGADIEKIKNAAYPPEFGAAMERLTGIKATRGLVDESGRPSRTGATADIDMARQAAWAKYVDENYAAAADRIRRVIKLSFDKKIKIIKEKSQGDVILETTGRAKTGSLAKVLLDSTVGMTVEQRRSAIERAYYLFSKHQALDVDGDSWIKMLNNLLHQDDLEKTIKLSFNEAKHLDVTELLVDRDGVVFEPQKIGNFNARLLTAAEVDRAFSNSGYIEAIKIKELVKRNNLDVYVQYNTNPKPGQKQYSIIVAKVVTSKDGKKVIGIDDQVTLGQAYQPGERLDSPEQKIQYINERLKSYGADNMFKAAVIDDITGLIGLVPNIDGWDGLGNFEFDLITKGDSNIRTKHYKMLLDAVVRHDFVNRIHNEFIAAGIQSPFSPEDRDLKAVIARTIKIWNDPNEKAKLGPAGPFEARLTSYRNGELRRFTRPTTTGTPGSNLALELRSRLLETEKQQRPGVDPMFESALESRTLGAGQAAEVAGAGRPLGTGGRIVLSPSERSFYRRFRSMGTGQKLANIMGGGLGGIALGLAQNALQNKLMYGENADQITKQQMPIATAFEVLAAADPRLAAAGQLAFTGLNKGDMLRALINMAAAFGGGAAAGLVGSKFGPLGQLAGSYVGSTAASMATDSIYGAVAGNQAPDYNVAPSNVAVSTPTTLGMPSMPGSARDVQDVIDKLGG